MPGDLFNCLAQGVTKVRLAKVLDRAAREGVGGELVAEVAGAEDDAHVGVEHEEVGERFDAGHTWHDDVEQNTREVARRLAEAFDRGRAVVSLDTLITKRADHATRQRT